MSPGCYNVTCVDAMVRFITTLSALLLAALPVWAAETANPSSHNTTRIAIRLDTSDAVPVRTRFQEEPPILEIKFPRQKVAASLPERMTVGRGAIQGLRAHYESRRQGSTRFLQSLEIELSGPYTHRVRSEPGHVIVEIDHPASVSGTSMEIGMRTGHVIRAAVGPVSERFLAMQDALQRARPTTVTMRWVGDQIPSARIRGPGIPTPSGYDETAAGIQPAARAGNAPHGGARPPLLGIIGLAALAASGAAGFWVFSRRPPPAAAAMPPSILLVDQLIWRAFERQGYQLVLEQEQTDPPAGTVRVIAKDEEKWALLFVGAGRFFEKQSIDRFIRTMRNLRVTQGFLVASGSFTIPAQRVAKGHGITLIGRDQLVELLSLGAGNEHFTRQLEQSHSRLEEAKDTLHQYTVELETLRRQRNEASWHLGEERSRAAKQELQLEELRQQLARYESDLKRWEEETVARRKQWEESQWYLGEARERSRHLERYTAELERATVGLGAIQQERDDAALAAASSAARIEELERQLADSIHRTQEPAAIGERRRLGRVKIPGALVEVLNGTPHPATSGEVRDVSPTGIGLDTTGELGRRPTVRVRVTVPGRDPIESQARIVWQRSTQTGRFHSGCRFLRLPAASRVVLEELIQEFEAPAGA